MVPGSTTLGVVIGPRPDTDAHPVVRSAPASASARAFRNIVFS
jgi:hypothetical protein